MPHRQEVPQCEHARSASGSVQDARVVHVFVLGIDPGLSRCGYGAVRQRGRVQVAEALGVVRTDPADELATRLAVLRNDIAALLDELGPDVVVVERIFFQVNVRTAISVAQASGVVLAEAAARGCAVAQYSPNEVKLAVTGDGAADKLAVATMVARLLGLASPPKPADAADAAALALCHLAHAPVRQALAKAGAPR